jgi:hypothetical protein
MDYNYMQNEWSQIAQLLNLFGGASALLYYLID